MSVHRKQSGVTLVEVLVASAVCVVIALSLYQVVSVLFSTIGSIRVRTVLAEIASQKMEFIRNLTYDNVGTIGGVPSGVISQNESFEQNSKTFGVRTTIRNIDNPQDGTIGGSPNDLSPADNKLIHIEVVCTSCPRQEMVKYTSIIAPKYLETENGNGALIIKVVDANGEPLVGANVRVVNTNILPNIDISDVTDTRGVLAIVDTPPSTQEYQIIVSKDGYSTEQTYLYGDPSNPDPTKPHLTVSANTVTQDTFSIDTLATLSFSAYSPQCAPVSGLPVAVTGTKIIGNPNILKKNQTYTTDTAGMFSEDALEWDTYSVSIGNTHQVIGMSRINPSVVAPGGLLEIDAVVDTLLGDRTAIGVFDGNSGNALPGSIIRLTKSGTTDTYIAGQSYIVHRDWDAMLSSATGVSVVADTARLASINGSYVQSGELISPTIDMGEGGVLKSLTAQFETPPGTTMRVQVATNTDNQTWNFVGPDGTSDSYFDVPVTLSKAGRYAQYKVFFSTSDVSQTPQLEQVTLGYQNSCTSASSVSIEGASAGTYSLSAEKNGFETGLKTITIPNTNYEAISLTAI